VLVAPTNFVVEPKARNRCAVGVEVDPLGVGKIVAQAFGVRHFDASHEIDHHSHLLTLGGRTGRDLGDGENDGKREHSHCCGHSELLSLRKNQAGCWATVPLTVVSSRATSRATVGSHAVA
jgi:hypothetical protein